MAKPMNEVARAEREAKEQARTDKRRLNDARAAWDALSLDEQLEAVEMILDTRSDELRAAYRGVVGFGVGYRTRQRGKIRKVVEEVCLAFIVKKKMRGKPAKTASGLVPKHVFTHWLIDGEPALCAVPTDVECATEYEFATGAAMTSKVTAKSGSKRVGGAVCCVVKSPNNPSRLYAIGCHHVFAMSKRMAEVPEEVVVSLDNTKETRVGTLSHHGVIQPGAGSFDGAMVLIDAGVKLHTARNLPSTTRFARRLTQLPKHQEARIRTPGGVVSAKVVRRVHELRFENADQLRKAYKRRPPIVMRGLYELMVHGNRNTAGGDSGSPVYSQTGLVLLGMHIGGNKNGARKTFMIPAFELLRTKNYRFPSAEDHFELKTRD